EDTGDDFGMKKPDGGVVGLRHAHEHAALHFFRSQHGKTGHLLFQQNIDDAAQRLAVDAAVNGYVSGVDLGGDAGVAVPDAACGFFEGDVVERRMAGDDGEIQFAGHLLDGVDTAESAAFRAVFVN